VNLLPPYEFVKNSGAPHCVVALIKGIAINGERRLARHAAIFHNSMINFGF